MPTFTVHAPRPAGQPRVEAEGAVFVPEGFAWSALFCGPFWLIRHRLWRALAGWAVASLGLAAALTALKLGVALPWLWLLVAIYLGLEGSTLRRAALARSDRDMVDVVAGPDLETCERTYFERSGLFGPPPSRPAPPVLPIQNGGEQQIIGLFPQAGGRA